MDTRTAYLITDILSDDYARRSTFGAGSPLRLSRLAAAKTGTTQDWRENWTVGYTPDLVVGVWAGNADNEPMRHVSGVTGAAPIWRDVMEELLKARPVRDFSVPAGLVEKTVCADNGLLPILDFKFQILDLERKSAIPCPHTITELFIAGTEPQRFDDWHQAVAIDRRNGLRAGPGCPLDFVILQTFTRYPAEAQAWAKKQGVAQPPADYSPLCPNTQPANDGRPTTDDGRQLTNDQGQMTRDQQPISQALIFTSPDQGTVFRLVPNIPADKQKILVSVRPAEGVQLQQVALLINGRPLADGPETLWQMSPGVYTFEAVGIDAAGNKVRADGVTVEVVE
jgi:membrane carboxypeptidase/penicillin-binding protein PbpC